MITQEELDALPPKAKKHPHVVELYQTKPFLEAYAAHTDLRVAENPRGAVGNHLDWDQHGMLQAAFLIKFGLKQNHYLLDIGCGTGRLARQIVPCLHEGHYNGVDISHEAISAALDLAATERWGGYLPNFHYDIDTVKDKIDIAWAYSVFIHLPLDIVTDIMRKVAARLRHERSAFLFAFVPEKVSIRTGLKQFRHTSEDYERAASEAGLTIGEFPNWVEWTTGGDHPQWAGNQRIAVARRKA